MYCAKRWMELGALAALAMITENAAAQQVITARQSIPAQRIITTAQVIPANLAPASQYFCERCGRVHTRSTSLSPTGTGGATDVLAALNAQRARQGLGQLMPDPQLQAVAQQRASQMASTGNKNHPPGSFSPGRYEGVGWSSSFSPNGVSACFTSDPNMRVAGAAMATGRDGVYFCVVYR